MFCWAYSSVGQSTRLISVGSMVQIHLGPNDFGAVAQLGERLLCKQEVAGSTPVCSIKEAVRTGRSSEGRDVIQI